MPVPLIGLRQETNITVLTAGTWKMMTALLLRMVEGLMKKEKR